MATAKKLQQVARFEADQRKLHRIGSASAARIGRRVRLAALGAYRARRDPVSSVRAELQPLRGLILDGMLAAYLQGKRRALLNVKPKLRDRAQLSVYDEAISTLRQLAGLSVEDLEAIRITLGPHVTTTFDQLVNGVQGQVSDAVLEITEQQLHTQGGMAVLRKAFDDAGITPEHSYQIENIFRTQTQLAYSGGRWSTYQDPAIDDILWGFEYVTVGDDRVRPNHEAMDGTRLPKSHPFWDSNFPPNGFSCRCSVIEIFDGDAEATEQLPQLINNAQPVADLGWGFNAGNVMM